MGTIKGLEYILAFITFPYLVRVLQVEQYGLMVFAQSIVQYFVLLTDYGFNLLGPREIAQHDSVQERGAVFSNIFFAKILLLFFSTIIFVCGLFWLEEYGEVDIVLYLTFYLMVIGNVLFPVWFFQIMYVFHRQQQQSHGLLHRLWHFQSKHSKQANSSGWKY